MNQPQLFNFHGQPTIDSREVAKMIGKRHTDLIRDIRRYIKNLGPDAKLRPAKFFVESTYEDANGQVRPCYLLTKKGCEFVGNKMHGKKGDQFTARYVDLFNDYQEEHKAIEAHMTSDEIAMRNRELEFKKQWLKQMEAQNANKRAELLMKLAQHTHGSLYQELMNEATNQLTFPIYQDKVFTAGDIANQLGTDPYTIGIWGQRLGLKAPKGTAGRYGYWKNDRYYYNQLAFNNMVDHQEDILGD